eukprot:2282609-Alexandrium_andersonii.AAC.1
MAPSTGRLPPQGGSLHRAAPSTERLPPQVFEPSASDRETSPVARRTPQVAKLIFQVARWPPQVIGRLR